MKILWLGDLAATGFGTVTWDTVREMLKLGEDVRMVSQNDFDNLPVEYATRTLDARSLELAEEDDPHGRFQPTSALRKLLSGHGEGLSLANGDPWGNWKPDAVFLLGDFYGMRLMAEPFLEEFAKVPTFHYVPIEGHDLPPSWNEVWKVIKPIAMSKFGQDEIEKVTGVRPPLVYHGVNTDAFWPVSTTHPIILNDVDDQGKDRKVVLSSKAACKTYLLGSPLPTFIFRADRNMPRKGYPSLFRALAPVMAERPMTLLGVHARRWDQGGFLDDSVSKFPDVAKRIFMPDFGSVPREILHVMYNAADLYVSTSAEGFGLTIAEAVACGVPAVGLDYSAVPEVIGPAGVTVPVGRYLDNEYAHHWALPDESAFGRAVAYLLDHPHRRQELGRQGPAHVEKNFRWDVAAERFVAIASAKQSAVAEPELVAA